MTHQECLLDDAGMQDFVRNGSVTVKTDFPADFHASVYQQIEAMFEQEGNLGNNLLPRVPGIQDIFDHPRVHGALISILGPQYFLHPHRYCHFNPPGSDGQRLHKDSWSKRHHRTRWAMAFYYPQDVTEAMGPTGVVAGSQYYNTHPGERPETPLCGEAGTVTIVHYDLWHRGMPNRSQKKRYMVKLLFTRLEEPERPSWSSSRTTWSDGHDPQHLMRKSVWAWYCGKQDTPLDGLAVDGTASEWLQQLRSDSETACLQAAYTLGAMGAPAVPSLMDALRDESEWVRRNAGYALCAMGTTAVPALIDAVREPSEWARASVVDILGDIGWPAREAVPVLITALRDPADPVRRAAAEALGTMKAATQDAIPTLMETLRDPDEWVRRNTALTLARMGRLAEPATPALIDALRDGNRYVRAKAAKTLERIGTSTALETAFRFYEMSRWCPITTKETPY